MKVRFPNRWARLLVGGWLAVAVAAGGARAQEAPAAHQGCRPAPQMAELAFLEGAWRVHSSFRLGDGTWEETRASSTVRPDLDGCLLVERYTGVRDGGPFEALGLMAFNPLSGKLQRVWADSGHGLLVVYEGSPGDDELSLESSLEVRGRRVVFRHRYGEIAAGGFTLESGRSLDGGTTWDVGWRTRYERVRADGG